MMPSWMPATNGVTDGVRNARLHECTNGVTNGVRNARMHQWMSQQDSQDSQGGVVPTTASSLVPCLSVCLPACQPVCQDTTSDNGGCDGHDTLAAVKLLPFSRTAWAARVLVGGGGAVGRADVPMPTHGVSFQTSCALCSSVQQQQQQQQQDRRSFCAGERRVCSVQTQNGRLGGWAAVETASLVDVCTSPQAPGIETSPRAGAKRRRTRKGDGRAIVSVGRTAAGSDR
ncbi:hypothetical protein PMIN06_000882 [Paraphaeosphaeria minitans]